MRRRLMSAAILFAFVSAACSGDGTGGPRTTAPQSEVRSPDVGTYLARLERLGFRGAVVVRRGGSAASTTGVGTRADGAPIDGSTRFALGSNSKPFTGLVILAMEADGRLSLDTTVGAIFPDAPVDKQPITVRQLLTHTSGLNAQHARGDAEPLAKDEALQRIFAQDLLFAPGSSNAYSDSGYTLLAALVEAVTGEAFDEVLRQRIFARAGLANTGFHGEAGGAEANGTRRAEVLGSPSTVPAVSWALRGAGGIVSTANDLVRLHDAVRAGEVVPPTVATRWSEPLDGGSGEGYGWVVDEPEPGLRARGNSGDTPRIGHRSSIFWYPRPDLLIVVLSAESELPGEPLVPRLAALARGDDVPMPPEVAPLPRQVDATGERRSDSGAEVSVRVEGNDLVVTAMNDAATRLLFPDPLGAAQQPVAPPDRVVSELRDRPGEVLRRFLADQQPTLGSLVDVEPRGVAPVDGPEPWTFVAFRFERGTILTRWVMDPRGQVVAAVLETAPPSVRFHHVGALRFQSFALDPARRAESAAVVGRTLSIRTDEGLVTFQ